MRVIAILFIFISVVEAREITIKDGFRASRKWFDAKDPEYSVKRLLIKLASSDSGKKLISMANNKASSMGKTLYDVIKPGQGSLTDTTLIRKFTVGNPEHIVYESESVVFINSELRQYDALLDLAHELTHFVFRKNFNPYKKNFSLGEFIQNTIEGRGGEVKAFLTECKIEKELFPKKSYRSNCIKISENGEFSYERAKKLFYRVGRHFHRFDGLLSGHNLREKFPDLTSDKEDFVSSAYGIPYPVAAYEEYLSVLNKVCENDKKRISYFKQGLSRSPASTIKVIENAYKERCSSLFQ